MKNHYKKYRVGVITKDPSHPTDELVDNATSLGLNLEKIEIPTIPLSNFRDSDIMKKICSYDAIYYRTGMRGAILTELVNILQEKKIPCINCNGLHPYLYGKIRQALLADRFSIPQPKSFLVQEYDYTQISKILGPTFVVKPDEGAHGNEVVLINSQKEFDTFAKIRTKDRYLYQEYISDADEYRVYTLGGKAVTSYKKVHKENDFRANLHTGGKIEKTEPHREAMIMDFGARIAQQFGADIAGIDILVKEDACLFLELNWQPGWKEIEKITGVDFPKETIRFIFEYTSKSYPVWKKILKKYIL